MLSNRVCLFLDFAGSDVHEPVDIFVLGGRFYLRHFYGIINNEAPHTDDLQAHISYRPWEQKQEPRYISALNAKRIPPLRESNIQGPRAQKTIRKLKF